MLFGRTRRAVILNRQDRKTSRGITSTMNGKQHTIFGVALSLPFALQSFEMTGGLAAPALIVGEAVLGALLPDIDTEESTISSAPVFAQIHDVFFQNTPHRGWTHSVLFCLLPLMALGCFVPAARLLVLGYASHLFLDALTERGIPITKRDGKHLHFAPKALHLGRGLQAWVATFLFSWAGYSALTLLLGK